VKKLLPILLFTFLGNHSSKAQNTRFLDPVFTAVTKTTVTYSDVFNDDYHKMDIYTPNNDNLSKRPLIVYVHGGAFYAGDKASQDCIDFCTAFAKKGYVAVSVNYRLANAFLFLSDKKIQLNAVLQSIADVKSSLRYFVKDASTTNQYKVDTTAFFLGGYSAGAVASLHTGWVTAESELDANLQDILKNGIKTLNGDAGNNGYSNPIKALYSMAGAVYQTSYISPNDLPVWMGHAGLGNNGKDFKKAVTEIAEFFYPMIPQNTQSIKKPETYQAISIYPNPTQGFIQIIQYGAVRLGNYRIVNGMGQNLMSGFICDKQTILDLNHLPKGYYKLVWENSALEMQSIIVE